MKSSKCRVISGINRLMGQPDEVILGMRQQANHYSAPPAKTDINFLKRSVERSGRDVQVTKPQPKTHMAAMFGHPGTEQSGIAFA